MNLAPVGISTYARPYHLRRAVCALMANRLARETDLYVFSDAAREGEEKAVNEVRSFVKSLSGFNSVHLIAREENGRVSNNRNGLGQLLNSHERVIWLEEDIVVAPAFLQFMNSALETYRDNSEIFSVCGYRPPFPLPNDYDQDAFVLPRFSGWGFATWKDRFDRLRMSIPRSEFYRFLLNPFKVARFARGGWDMLPMLNAEVHNRIDALDVKIFYQQFLMGMHTVYPSRHLAANIGHDGTGLHCVTTTKFDVELKEGADYEFNLPLNPKIDHRILNANRKFRNISPVRKLLFPARVLIDLVRSPVES